MTYRIEVFGFLEQKGPMVHMFGLNSLTLNQVIKETVKLNKDGLTYQIFKETE